jgi:predicted AlkP superfamily pyrophosphatase or phosphodiesterase
MVLATNPDGLRLADVLSSCVTAIRGGQNPLGLPSVRKAAVLVVDGLGAQNLQQRSGHARWLTQQWSAQKRVADAGYPSTTASALATLTTGERPGTHGIVGYTVREPVSGVLINHLKEWGPAADPETWQRSTTLFERAATHSISSLALGEHRFVGTDFTKAVWRGAEFVGVKGLVPQGQVMREFFDSNDHAVAYLYWPALDRTGHSQGVGSDAWTHRLEELDQGVEEISRLLKPDEGLIITADHGMLDIPHENKIMVEEGSPLLAGVSEWGGEPRVAQLYVDDSGAMGDLSSAWIEILAGRGQVVTREQIVDEQWLGPVESEVIQRIGHLSIVCEAPIALYRDQTAKPASKAMIGQHGSITPVEREIPVITVGAFA